MEKYCRKKISKIIKDNFSLPFFLLIFFMVCMVRVASTLMVRILKRVRESRNGEGAGRNFCLGWLQRDDGGKFAA